MPMEPLKNISTEEAASTLHEGRPDAPMLGTAGMQKLMDSGAALNRRYLNENAAITNANFQNVLAKDNTEPYEPQGPYQPVTLQMLQEAVFNSGGGDMNTLDYDPTNQRRDIYAQATEAQRGMVAIATDAEGMEGTDVQKAMTPRAVGVKLAPVLNSYFVNPYTSKVEFTTSTTWTVPPNVHKIGLWETGAGGGGNNGAGGGGGFCLAVREIDVVPGQQLTILIGAGVQGGDGGSTQVLSFVALGGTSGNSTRGGNGANGGGGPSSSSGQSGGNGATGGTNGGGGYGNPTNGGLSLSTCVNPFSGKRFAGGGAGREGDASGIAYGGFADVGPGGNSGENGRDGGGGGGAPNTRGGNGIVIIYY